MAAPTGAQPESQGALFWLGAASLACTVGCMVGTGFCSAAGAAQLGAIASVSSGIVVVVFLLTLWQQWRAERRRPPASDDLEARSRRPHAPRPAWTPSHPLQRDPRENVMQADFLRLCHARFERIAQRYPLLSADSVPRIAQRAFDSFVSPVPPAPQGSINERNRQKAYEVFHLLIDEQRYLDARQMGMDEDALRVYRSGFAKGVLLSQRFESLRIIAIAYHALVAGIDKTEKESELRRDEIRWAFIGRLAAWSDGDGQLNCDDGARAQFLTLAAYFSPETREETNINALVMPTHLLELSIQQWRRYHEVAEVSDADQLAFLKMVMANGKIHYVAHPDLYNSLLGELRQFVQSLMPDQFGDTGASHQEFERFLWSVDFLPWLQRDMPDNYRCAIGPTGWLRDPALAGLAPCELPSA